MIDYENLENSEEAEIFEWLLAVDDKYSNGDEDIPSDEEYDYVRMYAKMEFPNNPYFITVGSEVRGEKVKLPYNMGSLDQVYDNEIPIWVYKTAICGNSNYIGSEKLDGYSALLIYDNTGELKGGFSRGDGYYGMDITRQVKNIPSIPKKIPFVQNVKFYAVRGEIIIKKRDFPKLNEITGRGYKNPRNAVAGLMNSKEPIGDESQYIQFVAYEMMDKVFSFPKSKILSLLNANGFLVPKYTSIPYKFVVGGNLRTIIDEYKKTSEYELDGIVLNVDSQEAAKSLEDNKTTDGINPEHAMKFKVADASNLAVAKVIDVEWNVSRHGLLKPRVKIEPVELVGVTIQWATGFNAKFIYDNKIGIGSEIEITRSGDVIPFITKVITPTEALMPTVEYVWNDSNVDIIMVDKHNNNEVKLNQLTFFAKTIDIPLLKEGNIKALMVDKPDLTPLDIIKLTEDELVSVIGENGHKIYDGMKQKLTNISISKLMASLPFFDSGLGFRKFKSIEKVVGAGGMHDLVVDDIIKIKGFEVKTAEKIVNGLADFNKFLDESRDYITIDYGIVANNGDSNISGKVFVFTGFRDKELKELVESLGGEVKDSVGKTTNYVVTVDKSKKSGKIEKAINMGIVILSVDELKQMIV